MLSGVISLQRVCLCVRGAEPLSYVCFRFVHSPGEAEWGALSAGAQRRAHWGTRQDDCAESTMWIIDCIRLSCQHSLCAATDVLWCVIRLIECVWEASTAVLRRGDVFKFQTSCTKTLICSESGKQTCVFHMGSDPFTVLIVSPSLSDH